MHILGIILKWILFVVTLYLAFGLIQFKVWMRIVGTHLDPKHPKECFVRSPVAMAGYTDLEPYETIEVMCFSWMVLWIVIWIMVVPKLLQAASVRFVELIVRREKKIAFVTNKLDDRRPR